ncbi:MAG: SPASM domain-containing protein [Candidatus Omnitrophota bacterium]
MIERIRPTSIRLDASTVCQLKCPLCPTAQGRVSHTLGDGFLSFSDYKKLVDENPRISCIELSNWGEIFLNPNINDIIEYAYQKNIVLTAGNGVNLNTVKEKVLEGLVKYKFLFLNCSIDGASQETYVAYRRGGNFAQVIENIKIINFYKAKYRTLLPLLRWQFVPFGFNEHEIETARELAKKLKMIFYIKLSWNENYRPVTNKDLVRNATELRVASCSEYYKKYGKRYFLKEPCSQLWNDPQINWDGRILGCCVNYWGDFGNVFMSGLESGLNGEKIGYARQMLLGKKEARNGIPCTTCMSYTYMQENLCYMTKADIWNRSTILKKTVCSLIHILGWKRMEVAPSVMNLVVRHLYGDKFAESTRDK